MFTAGRKRARVILLLAAILLLDQGTKLIVDRTIPLYRSIPVIEGWFDLTHARNTGAAFGLLAGERRAVGSFILIVFSLAAVGFIIHLLRRLVETDTGLILSLTFILAGALGNLIDRVFYGEVIDFLDVYWNGYHWPAFNVADSFITVGAVLCLWFLMRTKGRDPFAPRSPTA
ncbi:MAG: signal peptidase II [Deltaproteobacteria bacterium]|nr:signal peptidase II [Deltaproteobacteria bacterium]